MMKQLLGLLEAPDAFRRVVAVHLVSGFLQGLALAFLVPFLQLVFSGQIGSDAAWQWLVAIVVCAVIALTLSAWAYVRAYAIACYDVCGTLIRRVGQRLRVLPLGWFNATTSGEVTTATATGTNVLSHLPSIVVPQLASMSGTAAAVLGVTFYFDWRIGVAMLTALPVAAIALRWLARTVRQEHAAHEREMSVLSARLLEFSQLQAVLRATGQCQEGWPTLEKSLEKEYRATIKAGQAKVPPGSLFHFGVEGALVLALGVAMHLLLGGQLAPEVFIALALMAARFAEPVGMLAFYVDPLHESSVALDSICAITDSPTLPEADSPAWTTAPRTPAIRFENVSFGYSPQRQVLTGIELELPAQSVTALVGPSGSGKSTLARLVARFWDVTGGAVLVDGADVRNIPTRDLMNLVAMVFQDVYLFDTTIEENVRVGRAGATDQEVHDAAQRAGLTEVIERLPQGWQTQVGEGGKSLSGGERQRVALARAFLKDAPILLLDEVTSALDGVNEAAVTAALEDLARGRTVLVIAHRLSTIKRADRIAVLAGGRIEAVGTHAELYAADGTYREFWDDQSAVARWRLPRGSEA